MSNGFRVVSAVDTDSIFEPASTGRSISAQGYGGSGGVLTYCPLQYGSAAPATGMRLVDGRDLSAVFAAKGSVSYLVPSSSQFLTGVNTNNLATAFPLINAGTLWNNAYIIGANDTAHGVYPANGLQNDFTQASAYVNYGNTNAAGVPNTGGYITAVSHNPNDTLTARLTVNIVNDGTWNITAYSTNGSMDVPANGAFTNANPAKVIASGNWSSVTGAGIGAGYTFSAGFSNRKSFSYYPVGYGGGAGNKSSYSSNGVSGASNYQYCNPGQNLASNGSTEVITLAGPTTGSLASSVALSFTATFSSAMAQYMHFGTDYEVYGEDNWYHRLATADLQVVISGGGSTLTGQISLVLSMNWCQATFGSNTTGGTGGGGGGGTGGCVTEESVLSDGRCAAHHCVGDLHVSTHPYGECGETHSTVIAAKSQPALCLRIVTERGGILEVSHSAQLHTRTGRKVRVADLMNHHIPVADKAQFVAHAAGVDKTAAPVDWDWDRVVRVERVGFKTVRDLTMTQQDQGFWATSSVASPLMVMHPNLKPPLN